MAHLAATLTAILEGESWYDAPLVGILEGIDTAVAAQRPGPGVHSIWEIASHIEAWNRVGLRRLNGEAVDGPDVNFATPAPGETWESLRTQVESSCREVAARAAALSPEQLRQQVAGKDYNAAFLLEGLGQHWIHHGAQIQILKRLAGVRS